MLEDREYSLVARHEDENVLISTVWLGLDHNWGGGPPLIFETMIFVLTENIDAKYHDMQWRWSTEEEAKEGHEIIYNCYRENKDPEKAIDDWRRTGESYLSRRRK
jgi:hypothetical protein